MFINHIEKKEQIIEAYVDKRREDGDGDVSEPGDRRV